MHLSAASSGEDLCTDMRVDMQIDMRSKRMSIHMSMHMSVCTLARTHTCFPTVLRLSYIKHVGETHFR